MNSQKKWAIIFFLVSGLLFLIVLLMGYPQETAVPGSDKILIVKWLLLFGSIMFLGLGFLFSEELIEDWERRNTVGININPLYFSIGILGLIATVVGSICVFYMIALLLGLG